MVISFCTLLANGEDFVDMEEFARQRSEWLSKHIDLSAGIPSHDTFNRVFRMLSVEGLRDCLAADGHRLLDYLDQKQICLDGKKLRGASPQSKGNKGLYLLNAWVAENRLCITQEQVSDKSNEIKAIPTVLDRLELQGSVVSIDAMGCQVEIAEAIIDKKADYFLAVKGNQPSLAQEIEDAFRFEAKSALCFEEDWQKNHGRKEKRRTEVLDALACLSQEQLKRWPELHSIVRIHAYRELTGKEPEENIRYYISSETAEARYFNHLARGHWSVENDLHWHLDVTFREDQARVRKDRAPQNLSALRKIALQRLRLIKDKKSLKKRRFAASLNLDYLMDILFN